MLVTDGFDFPCGIPDGEGYYVAAGLVEYPYYQRFRAWHTGEDWNANRPPRGDVDLGDPIYAIANGVVNAADYYVPSWGNIILIEHEMPDGTRIWSQYAHCSKMLVKAGDEVKRGAQIGTIGKGAGNRYPAHLHFEIRLRKLKPNAWGWSRAQVLEYYAHATEFIKANRPGQRSCFVTVDDEQDTFIRSESTHWKVAKVGYLGRSFWTYTVDENQGQDCVARWEPKLEESGFYEVMAFIPRQNGTTEQAKYKVTHRRGTTVITIDQSHYFNEWVSLGNFPFSTVQPANVELSDMTGETYVRDSKKRKKISFDAMRFILLQP